MKLTQAPVANAGAIGTPQADSVLNGCQVSNKVPLQDLDPQALQQALSPDAGEVST